MARLGRTPDETRRDFAAASESRPLAARLPAGIALAELSMGMSGDFEVAIEEGATMVRVGSALFEGWNRDRPGAPSRRRAPARAGPARRSAGVRGEQDGT